METETWCPLQKSQRVNVLEVHMCCYLLFAVIASNSFIYWKCSAGTYFEKHFFTSDFQTHYYYVSKLPTTYFYLTSIHACQTLPTRFSTKFQNALADKKKEVIQLTFTALNSQVETYHAVTKLFQFCLIRNTFFFIFWVL